MKKIVLFVALFAIFSACANAKNGTAKANEKSKSEKETPQKSAPAKPKYEEK
ncbi:MAG: hypothetical protein WC044_12250 [Crocinitomicaceae bacterium]